MTQAAQNFAGAKQTLPTCTPEDGRDYPRASMPVIALCLEGLEREEVDSLLRAMEFLCVLMEFYGEIHAEEPAPAIDPGEPIHTVLAN